MNKVTKLEALAAMATGGKTHKATCPECGHTWQMSDNEYENGDEYSNDEE
jgi:hypothetical protein